MLTSRFAFSLTSIGVCAAAALPHRNWLAPLKGGNSSTMIPGKYIVHFELDYTLEKHFETIGKDLSTTSGFVSLEFLPGYGAQVDDETLNKVRRDTGVLLLEHEQKPELISPVSSSGPYYPNISSTNENPVKRDYTQETSQDAPFGLQMLAAAGKLPTPVSDGGKYDFVKDGGKGVRVYILDTGIRISHTLFQGRVYNFNMLSGNAKSPYVNETMQDYVGHGTHVAGTVGAKQYGVAPNVRLYNVKVIGEGAEIKHIARAVDDVTKAHNINKEKAKSGLYFRGSIINMSFQVEEYNVALGKALKGALDAGITVFAAAGNWGISVRDIWPCSYPSVNCVAAIDRYYERAEYSNYGAEVAYIGPGSDVLSLSNVDNFALQWMSGTSMATPHLSGVAAIFTSWLGLANGQRSDYVRWNSLSRITSGFGSLFMRNYLGNTGIHSTKKYRREPFRWAGDYPVKKPQINAVPIDDVLTATSGPTPELPNCLDTTTDTRMSYTTDPLVTGLTTEPGVLSYDPIVPASSITYTSTKYSFDPTPTS